MNLKNHLIRTEKGYAAHGCFADECLFHRHTLLELKGNSYVISTIGNRKDNGVINDCKDTYETKVFEVVNGEIKINNEIKVDCKNTMSEFNAFSDDKADAMHECVVDFIVEKMVNMV